MIATIVKNIKNIFGYGVREQLKKAMDTIHESITNRSNDNGVGNRLLVEAFCGWGKGMVVYQSLLDNLIVDDISVALFPSLPLVDQFYNDYISEGEGEGESFNVLFVCSSTERRERGGVRDENAKTKNKKTTTNSKEVKKFINKEGKKIIATTYHSIGTVVEALEGRIVNYATFDEAHNATRDTSVEYVLGDKPFFRTGAFFTATPQKITKYPMKRIARLSFFQGVEDSVLSNIDLRVDIGKEDGDSVEHITKIYESIARATLETENNKILSFHAYSTADVGDSMTNAKAFADVRKLKSTFKKVAANEFPDKVGYYKKFKVLCITAETKGRTKILNNFDSTKDDEVVLLCSCKTIGEGVDTKNANMCVFVDPKTSTAEIIQNIGRITRFSEGRIGTVLMPLRIDYTPYREAGSDKERDEVIRMNCASNEGNYSIIMNVFAAINQDAEDAYYYCLYYPNHYSPDSVKKGVENKKQKEIEGSASTDILHTLKTADMKVREEYKEDPLINLANIANDNNCTLVIESDEKDSECRIKEYGEGGDKVYMARTGEEMIFTAFEERKENDPPSTNEACPPGCECDKCKKENEEIEKKARASAENSRKKASKNNMTTSVHTDAEFELLWDIKGDGFKNMMTNSIKSCAIECAGVGMLMERWKQKLKKLEEYIKKERKTPSHHSKDKAVGTLGAFIGNQKKNYKKKIYAMSEGDPRREIWEAFMEKYPQYFIADEEKFRAKLAEVEAYIKKEGKRPLGKSKDTTVAFFGTFITNQKMNYKNNERAVSEGDPRREMWEAFMARYPELFLDDEEKFRTRLDEVEEYIKKEGKTPSSTSKDKAVKSLGAFIGNQKKNYKKKKRGMSEGDPRREIWEAFMEKYPRYFISDEEAYKIKLAEVEEYIKKEGKTPSAGSKDKAVKTLGKFIGTQKGNYKNRKRAMSEGDPRREMWEAFMEKYPQYFIADKEEYSAKLAELEEYIKKEGKTPSHHSKDKAVRTLGAFIGNQKKNYKKKIYAMSEGDPRRKMWEAFMERYPQFFVSDEEEYTSKLAEVEDYINKEGKTPSGKSKDKAVKTLGTFIYNQKKNYKKKKEAMSEGDPRREMWEAFMEKYPQYFIADEEAYTSKLAELEEYIKKEGKFPSTESKDKAVKSLGKFISHQKGNYKKKKHNMSEGNPRREMFEKFVLDPVHLLDDWAAKHVDVCPKPEEKTPSPRSLPKTTKKKTLSKTKVKKGNNEIIDLTSDDDEDILPLSLSSRSPSPKPSESKHNCSHEWIDLTCTKCGRKAKLSEIETPGYVPSNPEVKMSINNSLTNETFIPGEALILDDQFRTTRALVDSKQFSKDNITCVENVKERYNEAKEDSKFGGCMVYGDFLIALKEKEDLGNLSLIYADFTVSVKNGAMPLLNVLKFREDEIKKGTVVGLTWANRNGGNSVKNELKVERFFAMNNYEAVEDMHIMSYGKRKNMNVCFYRKL